MRWWWTGALAPLLMAAASPDEVVSGHGPALIEASDDGQTLYYAGSIALADFSAFAKLAKEHPQAKRLMIASEGGEIRSARLIGSIVARRKLIVQADHLCASACTLILLSSADRRIGPQAKIGFHKSYVVGGPDAPDEAKEDDSTTDLFGDGGARKVMAAAGVDADFIDRALSTPSAEMWYPERDELLHAGVATLLADEPYPTGPSWAVDRDTVAASLTGPLWGTLRQARPALWVDKVETVWLSRNAGKSASLAALAARSELSLDLARDMAMAPDELLGRILALNVAQAAQARQDGYRICRLSARDDLTRLPGDPYRMAEEEALYIELLRLDVYKKPIKPGKALRIVGNFAADNLGLSETDSDGPDMDPDCRDGMQAIEQIATAPERQRIKLFRALLSLME